MPAWWLGPDLAAASRSALIARAAHPVFAPLAFDARRFAGRTLALDARRDAGRIQVILDDQQLAACRDEPALVFFLESLLTHLATQAQRSCLVVHAGLVRWRDEIILLPGERGAGKSTTTLWLSRRGGTYFADDLCFIDEPTLAARGLAKAATLKAGSFALYPESPTFADPLRGPVRYFLPPDIRAPDAPAARIDRLVFPRYEPETPTRAEPLARPLVALALMQQLYGGGEWGERALALTTRLAALPAHLIRYRTLEEFEAAVEGLRT